MTDPHTAEAAMLEVDTDLRGDFLRVLEQDHKLSQWLMDALEAREDLTQFAQRYHSGCAYGTHYFEPVAWSDLTAYVMAEDAS